MLEGNRPNGAIAVPAQEWFFQMGEVFVGGMEGVVKLSRQPREEAFALLGQERFDGVSSGARLQINVNGGHAPSLNAGRLLKN